MLLGSLQYRFPTKEALFLALMAQGTAKAVGNVQAAISQAEEPVERLRLAFRSHISQLLGGDPVYYVLISEWRCLSPDTLETVMTLRGRYMDLIDSLVDEAAWSGRLQREVDPKLARQFVFSAANWMALVKPFVDDMDAEVIATQFWRMFATGVLVPSGEDPKNFEVQAATGEESKQARDHAARVQ